jgi:hypothetical protein
MQDQNEQHRSLVIVVKRGLIVCYVEMEAEIHYVLSLFQPSSSSDEQRLQVVDCICKTLAPLSDRVIVYYTRC